eukprot:6176024-Pleurochrysis_carterae.AAC.1
MHVSRRPMVKSEPDALSTGRCAAGLSTAMQRSADGGLLDVAQLGEARHQVLIAPLFRRLCGQSRGEGVDDHACMHACSVGFVPLCACACPRNLLVWPVVLVAVKHLEEDGEAVDHLGEGREAAAATRCGGGGGGD